MAVSLAISEIFRIKEWHDLKIWVWGRSVTFYWSVIVTIALSCTICPFATLWIFILHLYLAPRRGWPCRNFVKMFDADKPEWLGYRMVKKLWQYVKPFSPNIRTSRTDRQTDLLYQYRASLCWRAMKIESGRSFHRSYASFKRQRNQSKLNRCHYTLCSQLFVVWMSLKVIRNDLL